mmetsp:Transcript_48277/g.108750  ORF Transcript_48277/g.108750 Transcript_48277/m.108750 type:complete len:292 (+) Transcript_48277:599-1474(+)
MMPSAPAFVRTGAGHMPAVTAALSFTQVVAEAPWLSTSAAATYGLPILANQDERSSCGILTSLAFSSSDRFFANVYSSCLPSHCTCQSWIPKRSLSCTPVMKKSHPVMASYTGSPVSLRSASAYAGSSVHSSRMARILGCFVITSRALATMPGVTFSTSTFSPRATASKWGTSSQPTTTKRCCCVSTPHSSRIRSRIGSSDLPLAVKTAISSSLEKADVTAGSCASADIKTGLYVTCRASCWKYIMKPQSPVMPETPFSSKYLIAALKLSSTSGVIFPLMHISNVNPGTTL